MTIAKDKIKEVRDRGMASDGVATNFEQIFVTHSPTTERKVL